MKQILAFVGLFTPCTFGQGSLLDENWVGAVIHAKKDSISALISMIDSKEKGQTGFRYFYSSYWDDQLPKYCIGINYVYLIDFVLNGYKANRPSECSGMTGKYEHGHDGALVKDSGNVAVKYQDLVLIKAGISDWWKQNQCLRFKKIKSKWKEDGLLKKMGYKFR